eukprot:CAMPEP_0177526054 /NCGR_PEP_ID=MMETSP0369-20130122/50880_1 /TAXON_ID=447022 ORGANISM="Scrippsiella hangoei-like, Strain SHHI-4" /NCGR_SAMPLE_ID=MMETSP0369 /ASSEMBLY_ACC=CAM_ASM_000364 /LENGTH=53 /DNA_ID=CAMNT_0019006255 /DNA_START=67 /DNA_END=225 /DNA_ORIENTATION=-
MLNHTARLGTAYLGAVNPNLAERLDGLGIDQGGAHGQGLCAATGREHLVHGLV